MKREKSIYISYLVRIWETHTNDDISLRASLERPGIKERVGFSNMDELFAFIRDDVSRKTSEDVNEA